MTVSPTSSSTRAMSSSTRTLQVSGFQLKSLWIIATAAVSYAVRSAC